MRSLSGLTHFERSTPSAWQAPFPALATEVELLGWMSTAADRTRRSEAGGHLRLFSGGEPLDPLDARLLPTALDASIDGWLERIADRAPDAAVVANGMQAADGALWRRVVPFVHDALRILGPSGGASLDAFVGRYQRGPFGVHKDDQDVFTFVVTGRKRFLVWPFEVLADRFSIPARKRYEVELLHGFDLRQVDDELRRQAIVLEGGPGDVLYWPADHWHVAESAGTTATLALGIFRELDVAAPHERRAAVGPRARAVAHHAGRSATWRHSRRHRGVLALRPRLARRANCS